MKRLAIIPARGGSKRIPRKNIKEFLGMPIIAYSIKAAMASELFDEIMVSTEDEEIATISKEFGAKVPFLRSLDNANDFATTVDVIQEVISQYEEKGICFDSICCIYPTAPFIIPSRLIEGSELLEKEGYDSIIPIVKFSFPIQRAVRLDEKGKVAFFRSEHINTRSQDLESAYHDVGQFYWFNAEKFRVSRNIWTENAGAIVLNEMEVQDIDNPEDWEIAEFKFTMQNEKKA
jgi:pseudaminic acid cytidylyltransferase